MTRAEKVQLNRDRQKAVRDAWTREKDAVSRGKGTVDWSADQQHELMKTGRVKGYDGHHMKSCSQYPQYAADPNNIQILSHSDHVNAHDISGGSKFRSPTNGCYDSTSKTMRSFGESPPSAPQAAPLSQPCYSGKTQGPQNDASSLATNAGVAHNPHYGSDRSPAHSSAHTGTGQISSSGKSASGGHGTGHGASSAAAGGHGASSGAGGHSASSGTSQGGGQGR